MEPLLPVADGSAETSSFVVTRGRFLLLLIFAVASALSAFLWISFSPIQPLVSDIFGVSAVAVNTISTLFFILYLPGSLLGIYLMEAYGLRMTLVTAIVLQAAGAVLKFGGCLLGPAQPLGGFALVLVGQISAAMGQPLLLNPVPRLSADWFGERERDLATIAATQANIVGQLAGALLPPLIVSDAASLSWMSGVVAGLFLLAAIAGAAAIRDRPPSPPSAAAAAQWRAADKERAKVEAALAPGASVAAQRAAATLSVLRRDTAALLRMPGFGLLNAGFSIGTGMSWALLTVEAQLLTPCGYSDAVIGYTGSALLGLGVLTSFAAEPLMRRTRAYALLQKVLMLLCAGATIFVLAANAPGNPALVVSSWLVLGSVLQPLLPLSLEHAAEMTYPIPADCSASVLQVGANALATVLTYALTPLLASGPSADCSSRLTPAAGLILGCMALGLLLTLPIRPRLARTEAERAAAAAAAPKGRGPGGELHGEGGASVGSTPLSAASAPLLSI